MGHAKKRGGAARVIANNEVSIARRNEILILYYLFCLRSCSWFVDIDKVLSSTYLLRAIRVYITEVCLGNVMYLRVMLNDG